MIVFNDRELMSLRKNLYIYFALCDKFGYPISKTLDKVLFKIDVYLLKKDFAKEVNNEKENN